jgi:hypothetical protein
LPTHDSDFESRAALSKSISSRALQATYGLSSYNREFRTLLGWSFYHGGFAVGASSIIAGGAAGTPGEFALGLKIGSGCGLAEWTHIIFGPLVEWWAHNLSPRRLGAFGTILLLAGFWLQSVQYVGSGQ